MKFIIKKESLAEKLADINGISERKTTIPIIGHVLLRAEESALLLQGTDTEISLSIHVPSPEVQILQSGATTVPVSKFLEVVRHQSAGSDIECSLQDAQLIVRSGDSMFRLATLPAEDFPRFAADGTQQQSLPIAGKLLHHLLQKVRFSMAEQDSRPYLNGLLLNITEDGRLLHAVSSDGHRLSCAEALLEMPCSAQQIILPKKTVAELMKLLARSEEEVSLQLSERQLSLRMGSHHLSSHLIGGQYANYRSAIPPRQDSPILIPRQHFLACLQRAKVLLPGRNEGVQLHFSEHQMRVLARNSSNETLEEYLDVVNGGQQNLEISLNINYLIQATQNLDSDHLQLHRSGHQDACLLTGSEDSHISYVIMSMRG